MRESRKLKRIIIKNLVNLYLKSEPEKWYNNKYVDKNIKIEFEKRNVKRKITHKSVLRTFLVLSIHNSENAAKQGYGIKFRKEHRITSGIYALMRLRLYLKKVQIDRYIKYKNELNYIKDAFNSLPVTMIRKEKLQKLNQN